MLNIVKTNDESSLNYARSYVKNKFAKKNNYLAILNPESWELKRKRKKKKKKKRKEERKGDKVAEL